MISKEEYDISKQRKYEDQIDSLIKADGEGETYVPFEDWGEVYYLVERYKKKGWDFYITDSFGRLGDKICDFKILRIKK